MAAWQFLCSLHVLTIMQADKVTPQEAMHDKCIELHVEPTGKIVWVSPSPAALFSFQPEAAVGKKVSDVVDLFRMWEDEGTTEARCCGCLQDCNGHSNCPYR